MENVRKVVEKITTVVKLVILRLGLIKKLSCGVLMVLQVNSNSYEISVLIG